MTPFAGFHTNRYMTIVFVPCRSVIMVSCQAGVYRLKTKNFRMNKELSKDRFPRWQDKSPIKPSIHTCRLPVIITKMRHTLKKVIEKLTTMIHPKSGNKKLEQSGLLTSRQIESFLIANRNFEQLTVNENDHLETIHKDKRYRLLNRKEIMFLLPIRTGNFQPVSN